MGERFASFEEAWSFFLSREERLESFYDALPDDDSTLAVWLVEAAPAVRARALSAQQSLGFSDWIAFLPQHFLHVTVHSVGVDVPAAEIERALREAREVWGDLTPFEVEYRRMGCFNDAVIAEAHTTGTSELRRRLGDDVQLHLPHLSLAYFRGAGAPDALRERLVPLRKTSLGRQLVDEVKLCLVPISKERMLEPWSVAGSVVLSERR